MPEITIKVRREDGGVYVARATWSEVDGTFRSVTCAGATRGAALRGVADLLTRQGLA